MLFIPILLCVIFFLISMIHFYWVFGGKKGLDGSLPKNSTGENLFTPGPWATAIVAIGLLGFGMYYTTVSGLIEIAFLSSWRHIIGWIIPSIFLIRAIGDLQYCGLTKRVRGTKFARLDDRYFTPLCLIIALMGYISQMYL